MLVITKYGFLQLLGVEACAAYCAAKANDPLLQAVDMFFSQATEIDYADSTLTSQLNVLLAYGLIDQTKLDFVADEASAYQWLVANGFSKSVVQAPTAISPTPPVNTRIKYSVTISEGTVNKMTWLTNYASGDIFAYETEGEWYVEAEPGIFNCPVAEVVNG